jgi:DNA-binding beta-propeller fold protein YncE
MPAFRFLATVASSFLFLAASAEAKPYLYVQNGGSADISVISIPEHRLVSVIQVGPHPDDVIGSADGKTVFVNLGVVKNHSWGTPEAGEIVAIDTATDKIKWRLSIPDGFPHHMSITKTGMLYVPLFDRAYAVVVDTKIPRIVGRLDGGNGMHTTRLSPDQKRLYAGSILTDSVYVLDVERNKPKAILSFRDGVRPFTFTRDEKTLYAQLSRLHGFAVYDMEKGQVTQTVDLPPLPASFQPPEEFPHNVNHGLELSPDEKYLFAAGSAANYVAVYTHPDLKLVKVIPVGRDPNWISFSPDGKYAYVGCRGTNEVSVISVADLREVKRVATGGKGSARLKVVDVPERTVAAKPS